jgi:hypothetical protein
MEQCLYSHAQTVIIYQFNFLANSCIRMTSLINGGLMTILFEYSMKMGNHERL